MITIGQILKEARTKKKLSFANLEQKTKIKKEFIEFIENNSWDNLPEYSTVSGFVKNLSFALGVSVEHANAILRRDYPPRKLNINPKPDIETKFFWSPKFAFSAGILLLTLLVLGYLGYEYFKFIRPPELEIYKPKNNEIILESTVKIIGKTTTDVILSVNNQPIIVDQEGNFTSEIQIDKNTTNLIFKAVSRSGKITEVNKNIKVEYD